MQRFEPNLIVSITEPYGVLDFDGPANEGYVPASKLGCLFLDRVGIFPSSLGNYGGVHKGIRVITIELPQSSRPLQAAETRQMRLNLLRWMSERVGPDHQLKAPFVSASEK